MYMNRGQNSHFKGDHGDIRQFGIDELKNQLYLFGVESYNSFTPRI